MLKPLNKLSKQSITVTFDKDKNIDITNMNDEYLEVIKEFS